MSKDVKTYIAACKSFADVCEIWFNGAQGKDDILWIWDFVKKHGRKPTEEEIMDMLKQSIIDNMKITN